MKTVKIFLLILIFSVAGSLAYSKPVPNPKARILRMKTRDGKTTWTVEAKFKSRIEEADIDEYREQDPNFRLDDYIYILFELDVPTGGRLFFDNFRIDEKAPPLITACLAVPEGGKLVAIKIRQGKKEAAYVPGKIVMDITLNPDAAVFADEGETIIMTASDTFTLPFGEAREESGGPLNHPLVAIILSLFFAGAISLQEWLRLLNSSKKEQEEETEPRLDLDKLNVALTDQHDTGEVRVRVIHPGERRWIFSMDTASAAGLKAWTDSATAAGASVSIRALKFPDFTGPGSQVISSRLTITATSGKHVLKRSLDVEVGREGFLFGGGQPVVINGSDREIETKLYFTKLRIENDNLVCERNFLEDLHFEELPDNRQDKKKLHAFSVAKLKFQSHGVQARVAVYTAGVEREVLSAGETYPGRIAVKGVAAEGSQSLSLDVSLSTSQLAEDSGNKEIEIIKTKKIIIYHIPLEYQDKLLKLLEKCSPVLGAKGVQFMRKKLWEAGQEIWLGKGGTGYEKAANWAWACEYVLDWLKWFGDEATKALIFELTGSPSIAPEIGLVIKDLLVSIFIAYAYGYTYEKWKAEYGKDIGLKIAEIPFGLLSGDLEEVLQYIPMIIYDYSKAILSDNKDFWQASIIVGHKIVQKFYSDRRLNKRD